MTAKEQARRVLDRLPDDVSMEEPLYRLYVQQQIERGERDFRKGRYLTHEQVKERVARWLR